MTAKIIWYSATCAYRCFPFVDTSYRAEIYNSRQIQVWIIGLAPVFMALLGYLFSGKNYRIINIAGIVVAFFGLLLLISKGDFSKIDFISNKGDVMVLASAFTWSVYSMINKKITFTYPPLMTIFYLFITMAVILIPFNISHEALYSVVHLSI